MKSYWSLILLTVTTAFSAGYYALFLQGSYSASPEDIALIRQQKQLFLNQASPHGRINLKAYYPYPDQLSLITRPLSLSPGAEEHKTYSSSEKCFTGLPLSLDFENFKKTIIWEEYRCKTREALPMGFFSEPPYLHPSGSSYAFLAYQLKPRVFQNWPWVSNHLSFFRLEEAYQILKKWPQASKTALGRLLSLGKETLYKMGESKSPIAFQETLYLKANSIFFPKTSLTYDLFSLKELQKTVQDSDFTVSLRQRGEKCFYANEDLCWNYNLKYLFSVASRGNLIFFIASLLLIILTLWLLYNKLKAQRLEDERRRLALQVLSHEFRTPVASLLITMESLLDQGEKLDDKIQRDILRASSDVHRLHRLVELSRHYIKVGEGKRLVDLKRTFHPSASELIYHLLKPYENRINFSPPERDFSLYLDEYWLGICLKNLVENALHHGTSPVTISWKTDGKKDYFTVSDHGHLPPSTSLEELTQEFMKGNRSEGSGLGLNIVAKIMKDLKGKLELEKTNHTKFTLSTPKKKERENQEPST